MRKKIKQNECMIGAASTGHASLMNLGEAICFPVWLATELHGPEDGPRKARDGLKFHAYILDDTLIPPAFFCCNRLDGGPSVVYFSHRKRT